MKSQKGSLVGDSSMKTYLAGITYFEMLKVNAFRWNRLSYLSLLACPKAFMDAAFLKSLLIRGFWSFQTTVHSLRETLPFH